MYAYISGTVTEKGSDYAIIEANGIGYMINCGTLTLKSLSLGDMGKLYTLHFITDETSQLFGFSNTDEREMFKKLISVSRIGKKIALSVLSVLTPNDVAMAVALDNPSAFDSVSGLGKKTACRLILELKEKVSVSTDITTNKEISESGASVFNMRAEAIEALTALGYDGLSAGRAVSSVDAASCKGVEDLIKKSLLIISK